MNPFVIELDSKKIDCSPDCTPRKLVIEDNIGESIHIHYRNLRLEMSINEFRKFAKETKAAAEVIKQSE